jgi:hypothetical protein
MQYTLNLEQGAYELQDAAVHKLYNVQFWTMN